MPLLPKLVQAYKNGAFGLFIGAGMSRSSGLPAWDGLLTQMIDHAVQNNMGVSNAKEKELRSLLIDSTKYLMVAEELKDILSNDMPKLIKDIFGQKSLKPSISLRKAVKLNWRFIITTNYDSLIEKAYNREFDNEILNPLTYRNSASINSNILNGEPFLLKAHGDANSAPNEIILSEKEYRQIIYWEKGYQSVLHVMFSTCNILFLGASLKDPELMLLLGYIHNIFHGGSPNHFALMPENEVTETEMGRWRKDYNITIITYDPHDHHIEIENFLDEMLAL